MQHSPALEASRRFLNVLWDRQAPDDAALAAALDRLVVAYHDAPDADVSDSELEAPRQDGASLYKELAARFPDYGLYPVADPTASLEDATTMGDLVTDRGDVVQKIRFSQ